MAKFNELKERYFDKLVQYVPIVAGVHGGIIPNSMRFMVCLKGFMRMFRKPGPQNRT